MPHTRRTLLRVSAVGLAGSIAGCAGASRNRQETTTTAAGMGTTTTRQPDETILLGGETAHWFGLAPNSIHGKENPTLTMEPGKVYEVKWIFISGKNPSKHELRFFDQNGNVVAATESASEVGATRSVTFEATEQLARYDCEYHPRTMKGQVVQRGATTTTTTAAGTTTTDGGGGGGGDGGPGY